MSSFVRTGGSAIKQLKTRTSADKNPPSDGFFDRPSGFFDRPGGFFDRPRDERSRIKCSETINYVFKEVAIVTKLLTVILEEITEEWLGMIFFCIIKMADWHSKW